MPSSEQASKHPAPAAEMLALCTMILFLSTFRSNLGGGGGGGMNCCLLANCDRALTALAGKQRASAHTAVAHVAGRVWQHSSSA